MNKLFRGIFLFCFCYFVGLYGSNRPSDILVPTTSSEEQAHSPRGQLSPTVRNSSYVPHAYDVTPTLIAESRCCFRMSRWILQPVNVVSPLVATGLVAVGEYCIEGYPSTAKILNGIGLGFSILDFISGVLLLKIDNKLEGIDRVIDERR